VQAQFLKPMVISISFGLIFGTFIVLFLLPTLLVSIESLRVRLMKVKSDFSKRLMPDARASAIAAGNPATLTTEDPLSFSRWGDR
jgi:hypothetical protein